MSATLAEPAARQDEVMQPEKVLIAGDWHGNLPWALHVIDRAHERGIRQVVQLGDFGYWPHEPGGRKFMRRLNDHLAELDIELWFVDGNHDNHEWLTLERHAVDEGRVWLGTHIAWLPRGFRWQWHGITWCAVGGAVSVDQDRRIEGVSWWRDEELSVRQQWTIEDAGPVDVVVAHDCPSSVPLPLGEHPPYNRNLIMKSNIHRTRLDALCERIVPSYWMFGHYHDKADGEFYTVHGGGPMRATGFDMDGSNGNFRVLHAPTMAWVR